ncbi:hypothetical protein Pan44_39670 [Caulifigura coniformis]|uniref:Uncharacterized protein n=2 Tax=Caulifigura coniformis TaxID=2527983 RepID=A0A517SII7_9PLAN|nr:hypothetical protein Pan44_39670 [Caulifigura coniformis]
MGFSQAIEHSRDHCEGQVLVDRIVSALNDARGYVRRSLAEEFAALPPNWGVKFFSDNLVVGYPFEEPGSAALAARFILACSQRYQLRMAVSGFFIRGALTEGLLCLTDDIIFGSALLECYHLESRTSIVPRVILAEPLKMLLSDAIATGQASSHGLGAAICRDIDGWWFVNYLEAAREQGVIDWELVAAHKRSILESLAGVKRHDVLPKYGWACRYHNMFCHWYRDSPGYSDQYRIERADETSVIDRIGDGGTIV